MAKKRVRMRLLADQKQIRAIAYWITRVARSKKPLSAYKKTQLKRLNKRAMRSPARKAYIKRYKSGLRRAAVRKVLSKKKWYIKGKR